MNDDFFFFLNSKFDFLCFSVEELNQGLEWDTNLNRRGISIFKFELF